MQLLVVLTFGMIDCGGVSGPAWLAPLIIRDNSPPPRPGSAQTMLLRLILY